MQIESNIALKNLEGSIQANCFLHFLKPTGHKMYN